MAHQTEVETLPWHLTIKPLSAPVSEVSIEGLTVSWTEVQPMSRFSARCRRAFHQKTDAGAWYARLRVRQHQYAVSYLK
jgi:hypothetical protein